MRADYFPREDRKECSAPATAPEEQTYKRSALHVDRNRRIKKNKDSQGHGYYYHVWISYNSRRLSLTELQSMRNT